ncbi:eef1akmt3 [Symbiodinium natans]|uniref:Eef1akmt3 protein n=1 Tax=Symbiodinium natans TaxID=878477 RepID=A0A812KYM8_9DINO|nr:eef1akmt3 [Symbiodinium natans]
MPLGACGQNGHDESNEHCFRCFAFHGRLLRIREEISSADMPTGGRLWDAGIFLAHWLASFGPEPVEFKGKAILELGSGCGLPGIVAAHLSGGKAVFTDRRAVLPLVKHNVAVNCPNLNTHVLELDWVMEEHRQSISKQCGHAFDVILMSDLLYSSAAPAKLKNTLLFFSRPGTTVFLAHKPRMENSSGPAVFENPLETSLGPWFDSSCLLSFGPDRSPIHIFRMDRRG